MGGTRCGWTRRKALIVSAGDDWLLATRQVKVSGGKVTTADFTLAPTASCT